MTVISIQQLPQTDVLQFFTEHWGSIMNQIVFIFIPQVFYVAKAKRQQQMFSVRKRSVSYNYAKAKLIF
ncbi:hypothetical protein [Lysinibacillus xylanilyticus]|uniref:hypothetical protein n=1 Tax=Lysinibacillus xylanilyticus TaxID=582475 RepID=UPI003D05B5E1